MVFKLFSGSHYGDTLKKRVLGDFVVLETSYAPKLRIPRHTHERAALCLVLSGACQEIYGQQTITCLPLSVLFRPAGEVHSDQFSDSGTRTLIIELDNGWLDRLHDYPVKLDRPVISKSGSTAWLATKAYTEFHRADSGSALAIEGLALELLAVTSRRCFKRVGKKAPPWLANARDLIHRCFATNLTLEAIAAEVGTHPVHLARTFRQKYRCTVGEYVRKLRVEAACRDLSRSDTPLGQVALSVGFYDQSHFSRTFKRVTGVTPTEYRTAIRLRPFD